MANLYVWFFSEIERRKFVMELLELAPIEPTNKSKEALEIAESLQQSLDAAIWRLESGKTKSPWYQLHRIFYNGRVPESNYRVFPWDKEAVFEKGFKSVYTQKSYFFRPGFWLVLKFRATKAAREKLDWVLKQIPESRLGTNVPVPLSVISKWKLEWVDSALAEVTTPFSAIEGKFPEKCLEYLKDVKTDAPELYEGDNVYLWEKLAFTFEALGDMEKAEHCLRSQAEFQPGCADAFLNLGNFFHQRGMNQKAIAAYQEGLQADPQDEFIYSNLGSLYNEEGRRNPALKMINQAILENPRRGLNFKLKGDIHLERQEYEAAISSYRHAVKLFDKKPDWVDMQIDTLGLLAGVHKILGDYESALEALGEAKCYDWYNVEIICDIAQTYWNLNQEVRAKAWAETALSLDPDCRMAFRLLADYYEKNGDAGKAKWYRKKAGSIRK